MLMVEREEPFRSTPENPINFQIRANPYANLGRFFGNGIYQPMGQRDFQDRIENIIQENVRWGLVGGYARGGDRGICCAFAK